MTAGNDSIYAKTESGILELQNRHMRLPPKLRALLVLVDGRQSVGELLTMLETLGLDAKAFTELSMLGLIEAIRFTEPLPDPVAATAVAAAPSSAKGPLRKLHSLYSQAIKDNLGIRGSRLQLQVERANSADDFRSLRQLLVEAVKNSKGELSAERLGLEIDKALAALR